MSGGGENPRDWRSFFEYFIWGALVFSCGMVAIEKLFEQSYGETLLALLVGGGIAAVTLHSKDWIARTNPNWIYPAALIATLSILGMPFLEEKRWPFSAWLSQSPSAAEIAKEVIDRLPRTTGTNLPNIEKTAGASHQYPTRSPSDADREILVVDNINTYIVENIVPAENTASHMVQNWLLGINPETRQGYIKSLNEQAKKFGDVYSGIAIPLKGHDVYCGLDLCSIVQSINLGTNNTTSEQLRRIAETLSSLGESINWKAIKEKNDSGLGGTDLTIEAINRGIFYPWAEKDMNPRGLVDDVLKTLSQRRNELAEQATKK